MKRKGKRSVLRLLPKLLLILIWMEVIILIYLHRDKLTADGILHFTPENPWLAALVILGLFALKSISVMLYSGILFVADGILFPLPVAILVNVIGGAIMLSIPYWIGKRTGASAVERIKGKYPKAEQLGAFRSENDFFFAVILRIIGIVPCDVASMYMGAVQVSFPKYLFGSLLGILPSIVLYPIMGMGVQDIHQPQFWIALGIKGALMIISALGGRVYRRAKGEKGADGPCNNLEHDEMDPNI